MSRCTVPHAVFNPIAMPGEGFGRVCLCIGPQNGEPHCPCMMRTPDGNAIDASWGVGLRWTTATPKPRFRVKAKSRPSTPEARNG